MSSNTPQTLLRTPEAARFLGLSTSCLEKWRCQGGGPRFVRLGKAVAYRPKDLESFISDRLAGSTSEPRHAA